MSRFVIVSKLFPNKSIHIHGGDISNNTKLVLWDLKYTPEPNQEWIFDGPYIKAAKSPGKSIHLKYATAKKGNNVVIHDIGDGTQPQQEWIVEGSSIVSKMDRRLCLHIHNGKNANDTDIVVFTGKDAPNSSWIFRPVEDLYRCVIISKSFPSKSIHIHNGNLSNGTKLVLWDLAYTSEPHQEWIFDGPFIKIAKSPGKGIHLHRAIAKKGNNVVIHDNGDGTHTQQEWIIEGSNIVSKKDTRLCLHIQNGKDANGTDIVVFTGKDAPNGSWIIRHVKDVYAHKVGDELQPSDKFKCKFKCKIDDFMVKNRKKYLDAAKRPLFFSSKVNAAVLGSSYSVNIGEELTETFAWGLSQKIKVGASAEFSANLPFGIGSAKTTVSAEAEVGSHQDWTSTKKRNFAKTVTFKPTEVGQYVVYMVIWKAENVKIPFTCQYLIEGHNEFTGKGAHPSYIDAYAKLNGLIRKDAKPSKQGNGFVQYELQGTLTASMALDVEEGTVPLEMWASQKKKYEDM